MINILLMSLLLSSCKNLLVEGEGISSFENSTVPFTETIVCEDASKFRFDENKINVLNGACSLKPIDQIDDDFSHLGFAGAMRTGVIWDSSTGLVKLGLSNNCNGSITNCSSINSTWTPQYSQLLGHWKLDEVSGSFTDYSGRGNALAPFGTLTRGIVGKVQEALSFGSSSYLQSNSAVSLFDTHKTNNFTYSIWVKPNLTRNVTTETNTGVSGTSGQRYAVYPGCTDGWNGLNNTACTGISVGTNGITVFEHAASHMPSPLVYNTTINDWVHVVVVYQNKRPHLYVNGVLVRSGLTSTRSFVIPSSYLGDATASWNGNYGPFRGDLDEYAVWGVALTDAEVLHLYQRQSPLRAGHFSSRIMDAESVQSWTDIFVNGQNDIKYQVRSCANNDCSDGIWINSTEPSITVPDNRFFQYHIVLEADEISSPLPEISSVDVFPNHYPITTASIENLVPVNAKNVSTVIQNQNCETGVRLSISSGGNIWYYWDGNAWSLSDSTISTTNDLSSFNSGLSFLKRDLGSEIFYFKAHLQGDGTNGCDFSDITIKGDR